MLLWGVSCASAAILQDAAQSRWSLEADALVWVRVADVLTGNLLRSNLSRWALWRQEEHWKRRRSIPNGLVVSMRTSIRRISAPHAKQFIADPHPKSALIYW
jgi:hypothetical protein